MIRSYVDGGNSGHKAKSLTRFNYEKFMQLAVNSFNVGKYTRSIDNCRLAVEFALRQGNPEAAAAAYQIWIKALFELNKYSDVKKICCEARSKFGNQLDLMYYEFKAALGSGERERARRLGNEFIGLCGHLDTQNKSPFNEKINKLGEVQKAMQEIGNELPNTAEKELERIDDREK